MPRLYTGIVEEESPLPASSSPFFPDVPLGPFQIFEPAPSCIRPTDPHVVLPPEVQSRTITRVSSTIHHIKRTFSHPSTVLRPGIYEFDLCESFTDHTSATNTAYTLALMNSPPADLNIIHQRDFATEDWPHGTHCLVYAWDVTGDVWTVEIESEGGKEGTLGDAKGCVYWPLYFVVRAEIWRPSPDQVPDLGAEYWRYRSKVLTSWTSGGSARQAAVRALAEGGERWTKYDVFEDGNVSKWGRNVVVYAVDEGGKHVFVALLRSGRGAGGADEGDADSG